MKGNIMKQFVSILSILCLLSLFHPIYGMKENAEAKEAKTQTPTTQISSGALSSTTATSPTTAPATQAAWTQYVQQKRAQRENEKITRIHEAAERILRRFQIDPTTVTIVIGKVNGGLVSCDARSRTFVIDDDIADTSFGFGNVEDVTREWIDTMIQNTAAGRKNLDSQNIRDTCPALTYYLYWLTQFLRIGNNSKTNLLAILRSTIQYLVDDQELDAVMYGIISRFDHVLKGDTRATNYPTYQEEFTLVYHLGMAEIEASILRDMGHAQLPTQTGEQNSTTAITGEQKSQSRSIQAIITGGFLTGLDRGLNKGFDDNKSE